MNNCSYYKVSDLLQLHAQMDTAMWTLSAWHSPEDLITAWNGYLNPGPMEGGEHFIACRVAVGLIFIGDRRDPLIGEHECVAYHWINVEPLLLELLILKYEVPLHDGIPHTFKKTDKIKKPNAGDIPTRKDGSAKRMLSARLRPRRQSKGQCNECNTSNEAQ